MYHQHGASEMSYKSFSKWLTDNSSLNSLVSVVYCWQLPTWFHHWLNACWCTSHSTCSCYWVCYLIHWIKTREEFTVLALLPFAHLRYLRVLILRMGLCFPHNNDLLYTLCPFKGPNSSFEDTYQCKHMYWWNMDFSVLWFNRFACQNLMHVSIPDNRVPTSNSSPKG